MDRCRAFIHTFVLVLVAFCRLSSDVVMSHSLTSSLYYYQGTDFKKAGSSSVPVAAMDTQEELRTETVATFDGNGVDAASKKILDDLMASSTLSAGSVYVLFLTVGSRLRMLHSW
jgi:hypothetical protein